MFPSGDTRASLDYVTLGLFCTALIDELRETQLTRGGHTPDQSILQNAIDSLRDVVNPITKSHPHPGQFAFRSYSALSTLFGVLAKEPDLNRPDLVADSVQHLLDATDPGERSREATDLAPFFRALAHASRVKALFPEETIPPGVRQLAAQ